MQPQQWRSSQLRPSSAVTQSARTYDINTLAGKVASVNGTAGLHIRFSALIEQAAEETFAPGPVNTPITPTYVLTSPLDGTTVLAPAVTVNQDTAAAPQNETAIAVDPNNSNRIVSGANDYVTGTWDCMVGTTPCSALGNGYSGTYYSNDGGSSWCCNSNPNSIYTPTTDPSQIGTLIPGVEHLVGGQYDLGGDPSVAFDSQGNVFYAGLGFNITSPPNTVAVNKGTFDGGGTLTWGAPTFINPTTAPSILNDKEWIAADWHSGSPFRDRIYVSWIRFVFNPHNGFYVQSPIFFAYSTDGAATFSTPTNISGNVIYDSGSLPIVGYDGTVYVVFEGSTRLATLNSQWIVKSTNGGVTWSRPVKIADVQDIITPAEAVFRVRSFPAGAAAPNGDLYVAWSTQVKDSDGTLCATSTNTGCHAAAVYSKSTDGGATWSSSAPIFPTLDASNRTAIGYPQPQPGGGTLEAPPARRVDTFFPGVAISQSGRVYMSSYAADVVSPWQTCASTPLPPEGFVNCYALGDYIHNARLDYFVRNLANSGEHMVSTHPINTRYYGDFFRFIGDYTNIAVGSDNVFHAFWTDTNNVQNFVWVGGLEFVPTPSHGQDVVTASGSF
ncbi:MAG: hypothetical protein DME59_07820 [Verrucomicrobia bacterium]|nr:MAG: hypothetical protein DME59_07820 [Verrucomicrobiota bacterium]PYL72594.1 MAG: hypothetical protein DMF26_16145 [Verrucomicrobiota bacterium]